MAAAPAAAPLDIDATSNADCKSPQGHATQKLPATPARTGPLITCQPPATGAGRRPMRAIHAGWRPVQSNQIPSAAAATCSNPHSGRSAGPKSDSARSAPTLPAATAPPKA